MVADNDSTGRDSTVADRHAAGVAGITRRCNVLLVADNRTGTQFVPAHDLPGVLGDEPLVTSTASWAVANHVPIRVYAPLRPDAPLDACRDIHQPGCRVLRVEEVAQHYDILLAARCVNKRLDVAENNGIDINVEQVFVTQRTIGVEQFHFRPPADQVGILQRQRFDTPDVREIGKAHGIRR